VTRWSQLAGARSGASYAARIAAMAATGQDMHGEATFCSAIVTRPARILDAGCGTGRVAIRLNELGYDCVGVDFDESMLGEATHAAADMRWLVGDLATLELGERFDLIVAAGNVIPLLAVDTLDAAVANLARHLQPTGALVTGFGLDSAHLPPGCPITPLADFDTACVAADLTLRERYATWERQIFQGEQGGYAVSVHRPS
jgi:ubiquinone/menaquinone biosynthesis C-methylase UbiE